MKAYFDKRIQNILEIMPEEFTILLLLFKFNQDAFRVLLFYTPVIPESRFNSSCLLPDVYYLDKFKIQFEIEIAKLKKRRIQNTI